jgi:hypothetical protein
MHTRPCRSAGPSKGTHWLVGPAEAKKRAQAAPGGAAAAAPPPLLAAAARAAAPPGPPRPLRERRATQRKCGTGCGSGQRPWRPAATPRPRRRAAPTRRRPNPHNPLPGSVFIIWGAYVSYCVICKYLRSGSYSGDGGGGADSRARWGRGPPHPLQRPPFRGLPWYPMAAGPGRLFEPVFKAVMGLVAAGVELRFTAACHVPPAWRWAPCWCVAWAHRSGSRLLAAQDYSS